MRQDARGPATPPIVSCLAGTVVPNSTRCLGGSPSTIAARELPERRERLGDKRACGNHGRRRRARGRRSGVIPATGRVTILVEDRDEALRFSRGVLGSEVIADLRLENGFRVLHVGPGASRALASG